MCVHTYIYIYIYVYLGEVHGAVRAAGVDDLQERARDLFGCGQLYYVVIKSVYYYVIYIYIIQYVLIYYVTNYHSIFIY